MTNAQMIFNRQLELMEEGILKGTGRMVEAVIVDADGNETKQMVEEPEDIHTYAIWKQMGYQVKKGQKAITSLTIWKHVERTKKNDNGEEEQEQKMFMKTAHFFKADQVEKITK